MTNTEAIRWLQLDIAMTKFDPSTGEEAYLNDDTKKTLEALDMAIAALRATSLDELPNQEEITCLSELRASYSCFDAKEEPFYRALSKGIEALRKYLPDSASKGDVVYRQAAENAIYHHFPKLSMDEARMIMHEVPSAQPEGKIVYCGECKHVKPNGRCEAFADISIRPSASDFCSKAERKDNE